MVRFANTDFVRRAMQHRLFLPIYAISDRVYSSRGPEQMFIGFKTVRRF